jgi:DnaD/phage-associated family protein
MTFTEFSTEGLVSLPPELFTEVLPAITLPSELKVTLHIFYLLRHQRGSPKRLSWEELLADQHLRQGLRAISRMRSPEEQLAEGLEAAVQRTTILLVPLADNGRLINWYLVNTAYNRTWATRLHEASYRQLPTNRGLPSPSSPSSPPSLMTLYEQNIGLITPMLVEELREAEERYPYEWIEAAMREAIHANARSWRYISRVLERWAAYGRQHAQDNAARHKPIDIEKYSSGPYRVLFQRDRD